MKHIWLILILVSTSILIFSCNKHEDQSKLSCIDVEYDLFFTIEDGKTYCFPDNNTISISSLANEYCPCNVVCVWEGQMMMNYEVEIDNVISTGALGSGGPKEFTLIKEVLQVVFENIEFVEPCSDSNPSPIILKADIKISKI